MTQVKLIQSADSHPGQVRPLNEDSFWFHDPRDEAQRAAKGALYIVADGMGGQVGGKIASQMAIEQIGRAYYADPSPDARASLERAIAAAHQAIIQRAAQEPALAGMGCTVVALVVRGEEMVVASAGDSRIYRLRGERIEQLTPDHTWVAEEVAAGRLTLQQARQHQYRNVITRSLGSKEPLQPFMRQEQLQVGDTFVLCSDGLHGAVEDEQIRQAVVSSTPQAAVQQLLQRANAAGGPDNITAIVVRVAQLRREGAPINLGRLPWFRIAIGAAIAIALLAFVLLVARLARPDAGEGKPIPAPTATKTAAAKRTILPDPTATPTETLGAAPQAVGVRPGPLSIRSDDPYPDSVGFCALIHYLGSTDGCGQSGAAGDCGERIVREAERWGCFPLGTGDLSKMGSCEMTVDPCRASLLLVGQAEEVESDKFTVRIGPECYRVPYDGGKVLSGQTVRLLGISDAGEGTCHGVEPQALEVWGEQSWAVVRELSGSACDSGEFFWLYTQARPGALDAMVLGGNQQALWDEEAAGDNYVLLRVCQARPGQLILDALYTRVDDHYERRSEW